MDAELEQLRTRRTKRGLAREKTGERMMKIEAFIHLAGSCARSIVVGERSTASAASLAPSHHKPA